MPPPPIILEGRLTRLAEPIIVRGDFETLVVLEEGRIFYP
jgi:hypothetical protein